MTYQHALAVFKAVDHDCSGIAKTNLEHRMFVRSPPFLTDASMVIAEVEEMANNGQSAWDFIDAANLGRRSAS